MRPIFLTEDLKAKMLADFTAMLGKTKTFDGKLKIEQTLSYSKENHPKATIWFTPEAWIKMTALVDYFPKEIGWQGFVRRVEDSTNEWVISDIIVYKQTVTEAHVDTNEVEFGAWKDKWMQEADEVGCSINFQGHSHVNMSVSPSGTDMADQATRMADQKRGYYIFTIQNKSRSAKYWIYDFDNNIAYDTEDIDVEVLCGEGSLLSFFLDDTQEVVTEQKPVTTAATVTRYPANAYTPPKQPVKKEKAVKDEYDDFDDMYYGKSESGGLASDVYPYLAGFYNPEW